ncbi:MAG TPA: universal stress protein [Methanoregula sp.]|nr:universal stress protein [Methanoregula sp.]
MFEKVLLPTDFSADSQKVLAYVQDLPGTREALLLHVIDAARPSRQGPDHDREIESVRILMEKTRQDLEKNGVKAEIAIETIANPLMQGDIPLTILEKAEEEKVSLIMMGARGKNTIQNILLGSVSANVIRRAKIPVLLMRFPPELSTPGPHRNLFSRVLVPVDFSSPSASMVSLIKGITTTGQVILLHVVDKGESEMEIKEAVRNAWERLGAVAADLAAAGIAAESRVRVGYAPDEINATAEKDEVTLILMSPVGEGWTRELRALFLGSTTNAVMRRAHRPVLIAAGHTGT